MHLWQASLKRGGVQIHYLGFSNHPRINYVKVRAAIERPEEGEKPGDDPDVTGWKLAVPGGLL